MHPPPDNLILLTDGLPTRGAESPTRRTVSASSGSGIFDAARKALPPGVPVNVVLFPMEGDPLATSAYWKLAIASRGSFISPSRTGHEAAQRRPAEAFSLSFLDCICCGFGAIVLLLVLTKVGEPAALERSSQTQGPARAARGGALRDPRRDDRARAGPRGPQEQPSEERESSRGSRATCRRPGPVPATGSSSVQDIIAGRLLARSRS